MLDAAFAPSPAYKTPSLPPNLLTNPPPPLPYLSRLSQALLNSQLLQFGPRPNSESSSLSLSLALRSATPSVARVRRVCWRRTRLCRFRVSWGWFGHLTPHCSCCGRVAFPGQCDPLRNGLLFHPVRAAFPAITARVIVCSMLPHDLFRLRYDGGACTAPGVCSDRCGRYTDRPWNDHPRTCSGSRAFLREARMQLCRLLRTFLSRCGCNHMQGLGCVPRLDAARVCAKQHSGSSV